MQRSSLMDGISSGPAQAKVKSGDSKNALKLGIAVVLLVIAAAVISIYLGWIPTPFTREELPPPPTAEETKAVEVRQKQVQDQINRGQAIQGGSN